MAALQAVVSYGCDAGGQGFFTVSSISIINQGAVTVKFVSETPTGANYYPAFPPTSLPYTFNVPSDTYTIECWQGGTKGTVKVNGSVLSTAEVYIDCFVCDIALNSVAVQPANAPVADGRATIVAAGTKSPKQYSLNGSTWQSSNQFNGISVGNYTAYVRYQNYPNCIAQKNFTINPVPIYGCTNPDANNYNPNANTDNGTCVFIPQYFATGGTMPNPIYIEKTYSTVTGFPAKAKTKHYVTLNLYLGGSNILIAKKIGRVRNGKIKVDISKDLQRGLLNLSVGNGLISLDAEAIFPFEIGYVESYDNKNYAETRSPYPKRNAVRVALPKATDTITSNVLYRIPNQESLPQAQFLSAFEVPVKFAEEPVCIAMLIDDSAYTNGTVYNQLFLERSYFDANKKLVQRNSNQVFQTGFVRFEINDPILPCVSYMEVCLNTDLRQKAGSCEDVMVIPPEILPNMVQVQDGSGNVIANVPAGNAFKIESGFSFGFGIIEQP